MTATIYDEPPITSTATPQAEAFELTERARQDEFRGWAARLLEEDSAATGADFALRLGIGLGLSALYGVAIGTRHGGLALLQHSIGVPLGIVLVALVGAPSIFIFLSLCRAPLDVHAVVSTAVRGVLSAGL